jgi:hypothetical protein
MKNGENSKTPLTSEAPIVYNVGVEKTQQKIKQKEGTPWTIQT